MNKLLIAAALSLPMLASAQNLLADGSFEGGLTGWTITQSAGTAYPVSAIAFNTLPGAFGELVPTDNSTGNLSPDAVGNRAYYFVDDQTVQTLSQTITVAADGLFNVGISGYLPANGMANAGNAMLTMSIGSFITSVDLSTLPAATWMAYNAVLPLQAGSYAVTLSFTTLGGMSKDLVLDRAYVAAVPEPGTTALLLAGLGVMGLLVRRRHR
jgi:hypothetical protein